MMGQYYSNFFNTDITCTFELDESLSEWSGEIQFKAAGIDQTIELTRIFVDEK